MSKNNKQVLAGETLEQKDFRERMESQCSLIERYQVDVWKQEQRKLTSDEAAREWIERFAEVFARQADSH